MAVDVQAVRPGRVSGTAAARGQAHPRRFAPPQARAGLVPRRALLRRLREAGEVPVVVVCAPAGFGKTTLLSQWAGAVPRRVAWISLGPAHRDPRELISDLLGALAILGPARGAATLVAAGPPASALGRIRYALDQVRSPGALVIDDAHLLTCGEGLDAVRMVCGGLPAGSQVALGCRAEPALRLGLLRSRGLLLRLGPDDLAMDAAEAAALVSGAGLDLGRDEIDAIAERTEGWPAGLYLAALAGDGAVGDYVEDEVLGDLTAAQIELLTRTSVLERLSASSCDAVLGRAGSGPLLADIERSGGLIVRDRAPRDCYRHHRVVADALRARLGRRHPELVPSLHAAASAWFERAGDAERAIGHAAAAGDARRTGDLVWGALPGRLATGRLSEVQRWLDPHTPAEIGATPALAAAAAWCGLERGGEAAEHWVEVAGRDGAEAGVLNAAAALCGAKRMRADAAAARRRWPQDSPWHALACALEGVALDLNGDRDVALERLQEGARRAGPGLPWIDLLCRAWLCLIAQREGAWERAARLSAGADAALEHEGIGDYATAALAHAAASVVLVRAGRGDEARRRRVRARALLAAACDLAPWRQVATRVLLARASVLMGDPATAGILLEEARAPAAAAGSPVLRDELDALRESAEGLEPGARGRQAALTAAETRVLRFLPTHHTFRDIGEHLHLSRFTVKSQALAVYRKLDVASRGEAVARARALGLLDEAA